MRPNTRSSWNNRAQDQFIHDGRLHHTKLIQRHRMQGTKPKSGSPQEVNRSHQRRRQGCSIRRLDEALRVLDPRHIDAIYAENKIAQRFLRDVQSWSVFLQNIDHIAAKDTRRKVQVQKPLRRRNSFPFEPFRQVLRKDYLPGKGRRNSLLLTHYEPSTRFLRRRVQRESAHEHKIKQLVENAPSRWGMNSSCVSTISEGCCHRGDLVVEDTSKMNTGGRSLQREDVEVIAFLLRNDEGFATLDLSRCTISDGHFRSLAQALAWSGNVKELRLRECIFTDAMASALADVLTVNDRIRNIDIYGAQDLKGGRLEGLIEAAAGSSTLEIFNGLKLEAIRAEGTSILDLSGCGLGYVESIFAAKYLRQRRDDLHHVYLHKNEISTDACSPLLSALSRQNQLRSLDLSYNKIDERALPQIARLILRSGNLIDVNLAHNVIRCNESEPFGVCILELLSLNPNITAFKIDGNDAPPKMIAAISSKIAANRAIQGDPSFVNWLGLEYPRIAPKPLVADPRNVRLEDVDFNFVLQEDSLHFREKI